MNVQPHISKGFLFHPGKNPLFIRPFIWVVPLIFGGEVYIVLFIATRPPKTTPSHRGGCFSGAMASGLKC